MFSTISSTNRFHPLLRAAVSPSPLSQQTIVIIIVCASVAGLVLLFSLGRVLLSRFSSSAPLPPVQPLALHRVQQARIHTELQTNASYYLSPPPAFSQGSKSSLLDSDINEDQSSGKSEDSPRQSPPPPSSYSSVAPLAQSTFNRTSPRSRSISSYNTHASRRTRSNMIHGTPHGPCSNIEIILPAPLAFGLREATVGQPHMNLVRTPSFVDQWVTRVAGHEPGLSGLCALRPNLV